MRKALQEEPTKILADPVEIGALPPDRALLTSRQTAAALKISARSLAYWTTVRRGRKPRLNFVKLGKSKRFVVADVLQFIEEHKVRAA